MNQWTFSQMQRGGVARQRQASGSLLLASGVLRSHHLWESCRKPPVLHHRPMHGIVRTRSYWFVAFCPGPTLRDIQMYALRANVALSVTAPVDLNTIHGRALPPCSSHLCFLFFSPLLFLASAGLSQSLILSLPSSHPETLFSNTFRCCFLPFFIHFVLDLSAPSPLRTFPTLYTSTASPLKLTTAQHPSVLSMESRQRPLCSLVTPRITCGKT